MKTASDGNPGTENEPLKTISAAAAKVEAGDRVIVHGGDYRETVIITASGTDGNPIIFEAASGEQPVIKGSDVLTGWQNDGDAIWKAKLPAAQARAPSGKEASFWRTNDVRQVFTRDGALLDAERLRRVTSRAAMRAGTFFCDAASTVYVWLADSSSPVDHPPEVALRTAWLCVIGSHVIVRGFQMRHSSTTAMANWPAAMLQGDDNTLEDCVVSWADFAGVSVSGKGNQLRRNLIACHGACGVGGTGENHVIEDCRIIFNNVDRYDTQWHAGGAKLIPNFRHGIIRHNEFAHDLGPGLWLDGGCDENVIDGNYTHDNEGPGIMVEISRGNLVANNISVANRNLLDGTTRDSEGKEQLAHYSADRVAPSRFVKLYHAGDGKGIYISSAPDTKVLYNTAYLNEGEGICVEGPPRSGDSATFATTGSVVMNNISVFNHGSQLTIRPDKSSDGKPTTTSDHNVLFSVGAVLAKNGWDGLSTLALKDWQSSSGQDGHSLEVDPQFVMPAMDDYRLREGSPALTIGKFPSNVDHDFFGKTRSEKTGGIGACETTATNPPRSVSRER